jgi:predicted transcriptional regulator
MIRHVLPLSALVILLLAFSLNPMYGVTSTEIGAASSLLGSSISMMKSVLMPRSWMGASLQESDKEAQERPVKKPTKMTGMKVIFDSFYEEDYGVTDIQMEDVPPQQGNGRLSHKRKRNA